MMLYNTKNTNISTTVYNYVICYFVIAYCYSTSEYCGTINRYYRNLENSSLAKSLFSTSTCLKEANMDQMDFIDVLGITLLRLFLVDEVFYRSYVESCTRC